MTPSWVEGPPIGPEALQVAMQPAGAGQKEVYFDSSQLRAAYDSGGGIDPATYQPEYRDVSAGAPEQPPIPQEVLDAMRNGQPPPAALMGPPGQLPANETFLRSTPRPPVQALGPAAAEMVIPVGNGVTARVTFSGQPAAIHYRKLIRHLEIEADDGSISTQRRTQATKTTKPLAENSDEEGNGINLRAGDRSGEPSVPRLVKRRVRKNDRSAPEPGQP